MTSTVLTWTVAIAASLVGCGKASDDSDASATRQPDTLIEAPILADADGAVTAQYAVASPYTQVVRASAASRIAGASLLIPPQAFDIDMEVLIEEGAGLAAKATLAAVGLKGASILATAPAVLFMWTFDEDAVYPLTVEFPAPKVPDAADRAPALALLYVKNVAGQDVQMKGVLPASSLVLLPGEGGEAGIVRFNATSFGVFQLVYLSEAPHAAKEVETTETLTKASEQASTPGAFAITPVGETILGSGPRLRWEAADFADSYTVALAQGDVTCKSPYATHVDVTATDQVLTVRDGESFVCVTAKNGAGQTVASNSGIKIKVDVAPPATPAAPTVEEAVSASIQVTFHWQATEDVGLAGLSHYEIEVFRASDGAVLFSGPVVDATSKQIIGHDGETLYARVKALDKAGNESVWSANSSSVTIDTSP